MTRFEEHLRQRLADAADDAPRYRPDLLTAAPVSAPTAPRHRTRPSPRLLVAAAIVALVGAAAVWSFPGTDGLGAGGSADCAGVLQLDGRTYPWGRDLYAVPRDLVPAGQAVQPGCDDGGGPVVDRTMDVFAFPGLDPAKYLVTDRTVWAVSDDPLPASVRPLLRTPPCDSSKERTLEGTPVRAYPQPAEGYAYVPPYGIRMWADGGEVPGGYAAVQLRVLVTRDTDGGTDADLLRAVLREGARLRVVVRCDGTAYQAVSLSRA